MRSEQVATYLQDHPEFFEEYADLLASIYLPHPHGGRAIPLSERQILTLRGKGRALETKLRELIDFGAKNDAIGAHLHQLTVALLGASDLDGLLRDLYRNLREVFALPHVALRVWSGEPLAEREEFSAASAEARTFAEGLSGPYCSSQPMVDTGAWFGADGAQLRSFAYVPLRGNGEVIGMLALGSDDPQRFYPEMGTLYLTRLGELLTAAIQRLRHGG